MCVRTRARAWWRLAILCVAAAGWAGAAGQERVNLLFLYADDLGAWALGHAGNDDVATPVLDGLADDGARFLNAFVTTPVCSPARAGLMTGRYGTELGITDYLGGREDAGGGLDPSVSSWVKELQAAGYRTGLVGKWHLGSDERSHPTRHGYEHFVGFLGGGCAVENPTFEVDGEQVELEGLADDLVVAGAIEFLEQVAGGGAPFALSVHFRAPHAPWVPVADEDAAPYVGKELALEDFPGLDEKRVREELREYYGSVSGLDRNVGEILAAVERLGLGGETVVIFTSDNGYNLGHHGLWSKGNAQWRVVGDPPEGERFYDGSRVAAGGERAISRSRPNLFDTSLRVPVLVRWPGRVVPGLRITDSVTQLDWFPTLLEMAGAADVARGGYPGRSLVGLLEGKRDPEWDQGVFLQYDMKHGLEAWMRGFRTPEWKLVMDYRSGKIELYDLFNDPGERHNLAVAGSGEEAVGTPQHRYLLEAIMRRKMTAIDDLAHRRDPVGEELERLRSVEGLE